MITELDAINDMLLYGAGQDPVNSVEEGDETVARVKAVFDSVLKDALASPWPFNHDTVDLTRQVDGVIRIPVLEYLWVELPTAYVIRDGKVFSPKNQTYKIGKDLPNTKIARRLTIDKIDHTPAKYIVWKAASQYSASRDAAGSRAAYCRAQELAWEKRMALKYPAAIEGAGPYSFMSSNPLLHFHRCDCGE